MAKMYKVRVKGTAQLNGPVKVDKTVEMEEQMAIRFNGADRYTVIESFVQTHYPGVQIPSIRGFGAEVTPIKEAKTPKSSKAKSKPSKKTSSSKGLSTKKLIGGAIVAAVVAPFVKEVVGDVFDEVKDVLKKAKKK